MSAESTGDTPVLVPQPHGGALRRGGKPGNLGGRPANAIRRRLRGSFAQRLDTLKDIADNGETGEKLKALDLMAKYGLGTVKELTVDDVRERVAKTVEVIREHLGEQADALLVKLEPVWR